MQVVIIVTSPKVVIMKCNIKKVDDMGCFSTYVAPSPVAGASAGGAVTSTLTSGASVSSEAPDSGPEPGAAAMLGRLGVLLIFFLIL